MTTVIQFFGALSDGGAETLVKDYGILFKKHPELDTKCVLVALHNVQGTANSERISNSNVEIRYIYDAVHSKKISIYRKLFGWFYVSYKLKKIINEINPDVIHIHMGLLRYLLPIRSQLTKTKLYYTCHNEPKIYFSGDNSKELKAAKILINNNNLRLIGLHDDMKVELNNMFGVNNALVVNNGIDITQYTNIKTQKDEIRQNINIPSNAYLVGHIGRFFRQKNHLFLLDIFKEILKIEKNAWLLLVGNGPDKDIIIAKAKALGISSRIVILSHRTDIPELLKAMNVFVFPSLFEGLSVTLVEAQASGKRCVISDTINPQTILSDKTIPVSLNETPKKWAEVVLDNSIYNKNFGDLSDFDMNKVLIKLAALYKGDI